MGRGQVSIEYLMIIGIATFLLLPVIVLFFTTSNELDQEVSETQTAKVLGQIRDAADEVFYAGYPSTKTLRLYFPDGIQNITITGTDIIARFSRGDFGVTAAGNLTGNLRAGEGLHIVRVSALPLAAIPNQVNITDG